MLLLVASLPHSARAADFGATALAAALLKDMMPEPSTRCTPPAGEASSTLEWPGAAPTAVDPAPELGASGWDMPELERSVFRGQVAHVDGTDGNRSWALRVARGGNVYSFRGAYGEAMPPQVHTDAPWIDEVWQLVGVDNTLNTGETPYFVHQAGTYTREAGLRDTPFFSPDVASHCSEPGSCSFAAWGQQAHVPTLFESPLLYFTRFRDCGRGVAEVTWMMHHFGTAEQGYVNYMNVPWGGVRPSVFKSFAVADATDGSAGASHAHTPMPHDGPCRGPHTHPRASHRMHAAHPRHRLTA